MHPNFFLCVYVSISVLLISHEYTHQNEVGFQQYCHYQLMKFCPWNISTPDEWDPESPSVVQVYYDFLSSKGGAKVAVRVADLELVNRALLARKENSIGSSDEEDEEVRFL